MFDQFIKDVNTKGSTELFERTIDPFNSSFYNPDLLRNTLLNIDKVTDKELFDILKDNYHILLNDIVTNNNTEFLYLFNNSKFLTSLLQIVNSMNIDIETRRNLNKIIYDYLTINITKEDDYNRQLVLSISKSVNKTVYPSILGLGIPEDLAAFIVLSRYSSTNEMVNIKRVNFILATSSAELMTEQTIVWIYEKLFDKMSILFEGVMFDSVVEGLSEESIEIYGRISLAVLDMLNNMPTPAIMQVLSLYAEDYFLIYRSRNIKVRFPISSISNDDYGRILSAVDLLTAQKVYIP